MRLMLSPEGLGIQQREGGRGVWLVSDSFWESFMEWKNASFLGQSCPIKRSNYGNSFTRLFSRTSFQEASKIECSQVSFYSVGMNLSRSALSAASSPAAAIVREIKMWVAGTVEWNCSSDRLSGCENWGFFVSGSMLWWLQGWNSPAQLYIFIRHLLCTQLCATH